MENIIQIAEQELRNINSNIAAREYDKTVALNNALNIQNIINSEYEKANKLQRELNDLYRKNPKIIPGDTVAVNGKMAAKGKNSRYDDDDENY